MSRVGEKDNTNKSGKKVVRNAFEKAILSIGNAMMSGSKILV